MRFLYWNINNQNEPFQDRLKNILAEHDIDVLILSENKNISDDKITTNTNFTAVELLLENKVKRWINVYYLDNKGFKITHFTEYIEQKRDELGIERSVNRVQIFKISGNFPDTYFASVHFPSKLNHDEITHLQLVSNYIQKINNPIIPSSRLFIVGDFNMNPFDLAMVEPNGFNAHNNRELVEVDVKLKYGNKNILYYNPCWTLLGDFVNKSKYLESKRSGGSFFYEGVGSRPLYWYLIDQIIMRKALIDEFVSEDLEIIENIDVREELLQKNNKGGIDHFPLKFSFNFKNE